MLCACMTNPPKKLWTHGSGKLHACTYHTLWLGELRTVHAAPLGKDNWKLMPAFSWTPAYTFFVFFSSDDSNLYLFFVIKYNHTYNSFSEFCEYFQTPEGGLGDP